MPKPTEGESRKDFVKRCVPIVIHDGTAENGEHAVAVCNSIWEDHETKLALEADERNRALARMVWLDVSDERRTGQFKKDVIRVGRYKHPNTGQVIDVTPERLRHWYDSYQTMKAAGINIPIREGHNGKPLGHIDGAELDGDTLRLLHHFPDDDAVKIARRNRFVSIGVEPSYTDASENTWKDVIEHVAVTPTPVITGQGEFIQFSRETTNAGQDGAAATTKEESMDWLNAELGLEADATEDEAKARIAELKARPEKVEPQEPDPPVSAEVLGIMRDALGERLEMAQKTGIITPAKRALFEQTFMGTPDAPNAFCLSRTASKTERALASLALDILVLDDKPVKDGEATPGQVPPGSTTLARTEEPDAAKAAEAKLAEEQKLKYERLKDLRSAGKELTDDATAWLSRYETDNNL